MKILLTGASGFVGRHLLRQLLKEHTVRCLVRRALPLTHPRLEVFAGDVSNRDDVERAMRGVDAVVHTAALLSGPDEKIFAVNVDGTRHLVDAAKQEGVKMFIYLSSENVSYDYCDDAYSQSKREAEEIVGTLPHHTILRPSLVYGRDDTKYLGYLVSFIKRHWFLPILGHGMNRIQPVFIDDLVECVSKTLRHRVEGAHLVVGADALSYNEIITLIQQFLGIKRFVFHIPLWVVYPAAFVLEHVLSYSPLKSRSLKYLRYDRAHDASFMQSVFRHTPLTLQEGLRQLCR